MDEADALDARPWFTDGDGDDWGDSDSLVIACTQPAGTVDRGGDCDDIDPAIHPLVAERCDEIDNDCDGEVDENPEDGIAGYYDSDGDGWGATLDGGEHSAMGRWCELPSDYAEAEGDCDDRDEAIHPEATEICGDGVDQDCDGEDLECAP